MHFFFAFLEFFYILDNVIRRSVEDPTEAKNLGAVLKINLEIQIIMLIFVM